MPLMGLFPCNLLFKNDKISKPQILKKQQFPVYFAFAKNATNMILRRELVLCPPPSPKKLWDFCLLCVFSILQKRKNAIEL